MLGAALGYADIVKILLEKGADVNTVITGGRTALHLAASQGNDDVVGMYLTNTRMIPLSEKTLQFFVPIMVDDVLMYILFCRYINKTQRNHRGVG